MEISKAVARTCILMERGDASLAGVAPLSGCGNGIYKGEYCLLDWEQAEIPALGQATTADPAEILPPSSRYCLTRKFLLRDQESWSSPETVARTRTHLGVKNGHYVEPIDRLVASGMVQLIPAGESTI